MNYLNNVSMDYFLRGVEAAQPKNAPQVPQKAQAGANAVVAPELEAAGYEREYGHVDKAHSNALKCRDDVFNAMDAIANAAKAVNELYCPSLLTRDELPKIFK